MSCLGATQVGVTQVVARSVSRPYKDSYDSSARPIGVALQGLEKLGLVDQNWLERNLYGLLLRALVVGRRQQSESVEVALDME